MGAKKNFVLDTNVILHDYKCIYNFQENDVYIPIVVLEELDKFKKGNEEINYNARQFAREMDSIVTGDDFFEKGAQIGEGLGRLYVVLTKEMSKKIADAFMERTPDHRILATTEAVQDEHPNMKTILVTKDINLRMKARAVGLLTEDYFNDKITNKDIFDREQETFEGIDGEIIDRMYSTAAGVSADVLPFKKDLLRNLILGRIVPLCCCARSLR